MKSFLLLFIILLVTLNVNAQQWLNDIQDPRVNFFTVQKEFNEWKKLHPEIKHNPEQYEDITEQYYSWEEYWRKHIDAKGNLLNEPLTDQKQLQGKLTTRSSAANWQPFPYTYTNNILCVGRIDCIAISPVDSNTIWAGSPTGGLWKTTNNGLSWSTNTDTLRQLGISDIVIDPKNPAIMYIAMGDRDNPTNSGEWSTGVYKSTDTGNTWKATGLTWIHTGYIFYDQNIRRLIIDPTNDSILYAATMIDLDSAVVYKTTDAGTTWNEIFGAAVSQYSGKIDVALMPGNSSTLYVANVNTSGKTQLNISTNGGSTFTSQILNTDSTTANHVLLGVTPANSNYLYVLTANDVDYNSMYLSKNGGNTFTLQSDTPNIIGYDCNSSPSFGNGQGYYDLSIRVSSTNPDNVFVGGINLWQSTDAGVIWSPVSCPQPTGHADQHYTLISPYHPDVIYEGNDGGMYKSNDYGNTWFVITSNMRTTQYRGGEASLSAPDMVIGGSQDNGTMIIENDSSFQVAGGDGTGLSFFDYKDNDIYSEVATSSVVIDDSGNYIYPEYSEYMFNPQNPNSLALYSYGLYKSYDFGTSWSLVPSDDSALQIGFSPSFPTGDSSILFVWAITNSQLYKINGITGAATELTGNISNFYMSYYCVSNTDTDKIWVNGSINDTDRIFYTSNGGTTWTNITGALYGEGIGPMVCQDNSNDAIYIATSGGVVYTDASQNGWIYWSNGLPNIGTNSLSINYPSNELVATTFGRGIWETPLYTTTGINQVSAINNQLSIYPNPNNGLFTIQMKGINQNTQLQIFNVLGQTVYTGILNSTNTQINLSNHAAEIYLYRVLDEQGNLINEGKFVIE